MENFFANYTATIENAAKEYSGKLSTSDIKIFYSFIVGAFGYLAVGLHGAVLGIAVYYLATIARIKNALWAIGAATMSYKIGQKHYAYLFALIAVYLYIKSV